MLFIYVWVFALSVRATAVQRLVFPGKDWEQATPQSQGVDSNLLEAAVKYLRAHAGSDGVKRLVIIRNGRMIWKGPEVDRRQRVWSVTKAFTSTAHGLLIQDGKCTLDTLAKDYNPKDLAEHYPSVTLRHFATMTSGFDGVGGSYDFDEQHRGDENALVGPLPPFFAPGTKFMYWDEATQQYGYVLTQIAGEPLHDYLKRRIFAPIGISNTEWQPDATGKVPNWTGGLVISAGDLARFGHLFLNEGNWAGKQLIGASWVREATRVQVPLSIPNALAISNRKGSGIYGYHWWPNGITPSGKRRWPDAPSCTYSRSGHNNNYLFIIPAWKMVIVRLGLDGREDQITTAEQNAFLKKVGEAILDPVVEGDRKIWHPITVSFRGPAASETDDDPNPFLDYRLQVTFTGSSGQKYNVPGFFDGDGNGGGTGNIWRVRFTPDEKGNWRYKASFRKGPKVAVSLRPNAGKSVGFDGASDSLVVAARAPAALGFLKAGRLEYVGKHYLKFRDGSYWIRGGTDSPENFLAYAGFDNTPASHRYKEHIRDWHRGDTDWAGGKGKGIIGALNYLAGRHVNSIYFLTMNIGGDGKDVWPWTGKPHPDGSSKNDNLHFDISKLQQWEIVFDHAQKKGIFLHFVFNEAEAPNKKELDNGEMGTERKLYYRELIARFGHHLALEWNLCEEYNIGFDFGPERIRGFARYIRAVDPYNHPITVHSAGDPIKALRFTFGDPLFSLTSIQLGQRRIDTLTEEFRQATTSAGRPLPVSMDEFTVDTGTNKGWIPADSAELQRKQKLWPTYLSGGMIEFILEGLLEIDSFKTAERQKLWDYTWYARRFMQEHLPFWEMEPADHLVRGAGAIGVGTGRGKTFQLGAQVLARPGQVYAIYLPAGGSGKIDLSKASGKFVQRWYNPRTGSFEGPSSVLNGGGLRSLGMPPSKQAEDWVVLLELSKSK